MIQVVARRRDDERGFTIVFVALTIVVMLTFVAFAVDLGNAKQKRRNAQNAADGAALAAARDLTNVSLAMSVRESTAVATAKSYVAGTYGAVTWTGCTDSSHLTDTPDAASTNDDALRINYMMGLDHFIEAWGSGSPPRTTKICDGDMKNPPCTTSNVTDNTLIANYMNTNTGNNTNELGDGLLGNISNGTNA